MKLLTLLIATLLTGIAHAQQLQMQPHPDDTIPVKIHASRDSVPGKLAFKAEARELRGIAGAPKPFYTYFWEFGDGNFSFEKTPQHQYADSAVYDVRVYATNNYDDGKPPPVRPRPVKGNANRALATSQSPDIFEENSNIALRVNAMPRPSEEMVLVVGYRNEIAGNTSGRLALFYNEKDFKNNNFALDGVRSYHNEKQDNQLGPIQYAASYLLIEDDKHRGGNTEFRKIPIESAALQIKQRQDLYRSASFWSFENLRAEEERFLFLSLTTTPEMIQDTNAVITLSAVFIPDDPLLEIEIADLELQIVASHDPNKMMLRNRLMNYRFTGKNRKLNYKVRFQNTGEGPARQIAITVQTPPVTDNNKLVVTGMSPQCVPCATAYAGQSCLDTLIYKDSIQFIFRNVYLPGVQQDGVNNIDSTKGYISYQLGFTKKPKKLPFTSSAAIVFDKNEPIRTNRATGRFLPGLSPGVIAMYGLQLSNAPTVELGNKSFHIGFSISPYAPHRKYLQAELYLSGYNEFRSPVERTNGGVIVIDGRRFETKYQESYTTARVVNLNVVPLQLRYNLNRFLGVGAGTLVSMDLSTTRTEVKEAMVSFQQQSELIRTTDESRSSFNNIRTSLFGDLKIGLVRAGPAAGVRLFHSLTDNEQRLAFYLTWRL